MESGLPVTGVGFAALTTRSRHEKFTYTDSLLMSGCGEMENLVASLRLNWELGLLFLNEGRICPSKVSRLDCGSTFDTDPATRLIRS